MLGGLPSPAGLVAWPPPYRARAVAAFAPHSSTPHLGRVASSSSMTWALDTSMRSPSFLVTCCQPAS